MSVAPHAGTEPSEAPARGRAVSAKTLGVLAVVGLVVAFSLSSTLVKRAESPGVLVAFWRMVTVSVVWNAVLWSTGRRITVRDIRQVFIPGVFFGLNLALFFAGATHNSVANAALIGSLAPFLIVPVGAWAFAEYIHPRALLFAVLAAIAGCLAMAGVYGIVAQAVEQRGKEICLRMALGANRTAVLKMVLGQGVMLSIAGAALGLTGAFGATRFLETMLFEVTPLDPVVYLSVVVLLAVVAVAASYVPARRAAVLNPVELLKTD